MLAYRIYLLKLFLTKAQHKQKFQYHKLPYLVKEYAIQYRPSVSMMSVNKAKPSLNNRHKLEVFSPVFDRQSTARIANPQQVLFDESIHAKSMISNGEQFYPVPEAEATPTALLGLFVDEGEAGGHLFLREDATEASLRGALQRSEMIHLMSYGFIHGTSPEEAGLSLAGSWGTNVSNDDGVLSGAECQELPSSLVDLLYIDYVELTVEDKHHLIGFAPLHGSLLLSGVSNILYATQLEQPRLLVNTFFELLTEHSYSEALHLAKRSLARKKETANPLIWSNYFLLGR